MNFLLKKNIRRFYARIRSLNLRTILTRCDGTRILLYHSVSGSPKEHKLAVRVPSERFENELKLLTDSGYKTVKMSELIENRLGMGSKQYLVLTFDDGYKDNITMATAIMKRLGLTATFFITTSYIDGKCKKKWTNGMLREYMNWDDIRNLSEMGFEIGSHMVHHVNLTTIGDDELCFELKESRNIIYKNIKREVKVLSYPYGGVNAKVITVAKEAGYLAGCSSLAGINYIDTDRYILRRTEIDGYDTIEDFRHKLYGYYD